MQPSRGKPKLAGNTHPNQSSRIRKVVKAAIKTKVGRETSSTGSLCELVMST